MTTDYYLVSISVITILSYLLTSLMVRFRIIKLLQHRRIWNSILLITFFVSALLGLLLTIQINYKLEIPYIDQILILHVDFGITMSVVGIIHFFWHRRYYGKILNSFKSSERDRKQKAPLWDEADETRLEWPYGKIMILVALFLLGFNSMYSQIIALREFLTVFSGNELTIGIVLSIWMLLTGTGAYFAKFIRIKKPKQSFIFILSVLALLPFISIFFLSYLRNIIFLTGTMLNILQIILYAVILLAPLCLVIGYTFIFLTGLYKRVSEQEHIIGMTYSVESAGSLAGGLIFNLFVVFFLTSFQSLIVLALTASLVILWFLFLFKYKKSILLYLAGISIFCALFFVNIDKQAKEGQFPNQEIEEQIYTPYGNITITKQNEQLNFYENNVLLFSTGNYIVDEESVHYAMLQHDNPQQVLMISGGLSGKFFEIAKYNPRQIDYLELNPGMISSIRKYISEDTIQSLRIIKRDARLFLHETDNLYDIAMVNLPEPSTAQINRFYTYGFYSLLRTKLTDKGLVTFNLPFSVNYLDEQALSMVSVLHKTLSSCFKHVLIIPGEKLYFLASDRPLTTEISRKVVEKGLDNKYVNRYYILDDLMKQRSEQVHGQIKQDVVMNYDFKPISYLQGLRTWLGHFRVNYYLAGAIVLGCIIALLFFLNPLRLGMFTIGMTSASVEFLILISFQVIYGYVYFMMGLLVTIFMAGLALGAKLQPKIIQRPGIRFFSGLQICFGLLLFFLPMVIFFTRSIQSQQALVHGIFYLFMFISSFATGVAFSVASGIKLLHVKSQTANVYSADSFGASLGIILSSIILFPLLGMENTGIALAVVNVIVGVFVLFTHRKR